MPDRTSALAPAYRPGLHGVKEATRATITLQERRGLSMLLVACFPEDREALATILRESFGLSLGEPGESHQADGMSLLWQGPNRWLLVAPEARHSDLTAALEPLCTAHPAVAVTDLSHARSVIRLSGDSGRKLLAKECGLDLELSAFPAGACALTRFSHYAVTLHAVEEETLDLYITRSFALALWEELLDLGAEYGLQVEDASL